MRKNDRGEVQRLTIRTFMPTFLVDEISMITERSPVMGEPGYDNTARKRMFVFMLSGKDDTGVIAAEHRDIPEHLPQRLPAVRNRTIHAQALQPLKPSKALLNQSSMTSLKIHQVL